MQKNMKLILFYLAILTMIALSFNILGTMKKPAPPGIPMSYSEFMDAASDGKIKDAIIDGRTIRGVNSEGKPYITTSPSDSSMVADLRKWKVKISQKPEEERSLALEILISWTPMLLLIGVWIYFMQKSAGRNGGAGGQFTFGKSPAKMTTEDENKLTFADVAGCDEAKHEVAEIVDFLKAPSRYHQLGGKIPKGVLLVGSPGTGKTLLARAIAGEAKVPFFNISGSGFVEMFVGVGAARVRSMFEQAKKHAPCILFIDEIDAVGRHRGAGLGGGNDEREQTLNQLLVEMDGFEATSGIIIIAATNRPDILDPALLRPGRFDRQVVVPLPDIRGREHILKVHTKKIPIGSDVDTHVIARGTPGFSGADLSNLCNEAALFAARSHKKFVEKDDFEKAKDKIMMGAERKSAVMPEKERTNTAYHEAGHAVVAMCLENSDPVHKVTIIPRGRALGVTMQLPEEDRYSRTRNEMRDIISVLMGGRIAEEIFSDDMTTGASNDIERATKMAREMIMHYGMSAKMGPISYAENGGEVFLGRSVTQTQNMSEETLREIDIEIRDTITQCYDKARTIIEANRDKMEAMTKALLEWETLDADQLKEIMDGKQPTPPKEEGSAPIITFDPNEPLPCSEVQQDEELQPGAIRNHVPGSVSL